MVTDTDTVNIVLERLETSDLGTFGELLRDGAHLCYTCEDPWRYNRVGQSCIPIGEYECIPHYGIKYFGVWEVTNVPGRTNILIHNGNTIDDTQGCILVGTMRGTVNAKPAVLNSRYALKNLRAKLPPLFNLKVIDSDIKQVV